MTGQRSTLQRNTGSAALSCFIPGVTTSLRALRTASRRKESQPHQSEAHPDRQGKWQMMPIGKRPYNGLQQGCSNLIDKSHQPYLGKIQLKRFFDNRITRWDQGLQRIVDQMRDTDGNQDRKHGTLRRSAFRVIDLVCFKSCNHICHMLKWLCRSY